jgi:pimeloyl-ACP methyl ester carboxylesterase
MSRPMSASLVCAVFAASCATAPPVSSDTAPSFTVTPLQLPTPLATYAGELWAPSAPVPGRPVVVMLAGSGNNDRDGNQLPIVQAKPLRLLAEALAARGIGSVRIDKLGSGQTAAHLKDEREITFDHVLAVARDLIATARADGRFDTIVVLGHSEGALAALLVGNDPDVHAVVTVAGPGRNLADVLLEQLATQWSGDELAEATRVVTALRGGALVPTSTITLDEPARTALFRDSVQPYLVSLMQHDPAVIAAALTKPLLVLQGDHDIQVSVDDAQRLARARGMAPTIVPGVNHVLKAAPAEREANIAAYSDPSLPLPEAVTTPIVGFVLAHGGPQADGATGR